MTFLVVREFRSEYRLQKEIIMIKALRKVPTDSGYKSGDVMVVFGELFSRGYANGIIDEAKKKGLKIIYSTVGRRDREQNLNALSAQELEEKNCSPIINIPLEAGFDMDKSSQGLSPYDQLQGVKMNDWDQVKLDWNQVNESQKKGEERFLKNTKAYMTELKKHIPKGANVLFVHTMAGGVPRAKILMPTMNKVFKGREDRFISSEHFWKSDIGRLCEKNFLEVTANTFKHLIEQSSEIRSNVESSGGKVSYVAYGYHGTEVLIHGKYQWQTYTPYVQGWAKMQLEKYAEGFKKQSISCCVFNCPEILTNSSSIFQGLEVSLYPLLIALKKEGSESPYVQKIIEKCLSLLKPEYKFSDIESFTDKYLTNDIIKRHSSYEKWPQHNSKEQMAYMMDSSDHLAAFHKEANESINALLSEEVFKATGTLMFHEAGHITEPVLWIGHDVIAKTLATYRG